MEKNSVKLAFVKSYEFLPPERTKFTHLIHMRCGRIRSIDAHDSNYLWCKCSKTEGKHSDWGEIGNKLGLYRSDEFIKIQLKKEARK